MAGPATNFNGELSHSLLSRPRFGGRCLDQGDEVAKPERRDGMQVARSRQSKPGRWGSLMITMDAITA
jgi:hypothetical protein